MAGTRLTHPTMLMTWVVLAAILLFGYAELFAGATFIADEDHVMVFEFTYMNTPSNGWRADMGLGASAFMNDPGSIHYWAPFSVITKFFNGDHSVYTVSILSLLFMTAFGVHLLLRRVFSKEEQGWWLLPLAMLIVFSPLQHEFYFLRMQITLATGAPFLALLLVDYLDRPRLLPILLLAFLLTFTMTFGGSTSLSHLAAGSFLLFIAYVAYYRQQVIAMAARYTGFWIAAIVLMVLMSAWTLYPMAMEHFNVGYVRDPPHHWEMFSTNSWKWIAVFLSKYLQVGWLPEPGWQRGLEKFDPASWELVTPVFPLVFAVMLFRRSASFWEYAAKVVILGLWAWELGCFFAPGLTVGLFQRIVDAYPLQKFMPFYHAFEIVLLGLFLLRLHRGESLVQAGASDWVRRSLAVVLTGFYGALTLLTLLLLLAPDATIRVAEGIVALVVSEPRRELVQAMAAGQLDWLRQTWSPLFAAFYGLSAVSVALFLFPARLESLVRRSLLGVTCAILVTNLLMSWTVYPLARKPMIWQEALAAHPEVAKAIHPTDRLYRAMAPEPEITTAEQWRQRYIGPTPRVGYRAAPAIDLSYRKNVTPRDVANFEIAVNNAGEGGKIQSVRQLSNAPPLPPTPLMDVAGVRYVYADRRLPPNDSLELVLDHPDLYLYRYKRGWPFAYLAKRAARIERPEDMAKVPFGPAYLLPDEEAKVPETVGADPKAAMSIRRFSVGDYDFDYSSTSPALLVVADSWHPYWHASVDGKPVPVIKANGVFKAALLPAGSGLVSFRFDTTPYRPGLWVSALALVLGAAGVWWLRRRAG